MREAFDMVPADWAKPRQRFRLKVRRGFIEFPMFDRTFKALRNRGLLEWRGGPGEWEWRRTPESAAS